MDHNFDERYNSIANRLLEQDIHAHLFGERLTFKQMVERVKSGYFRCYNLDFYNKKTVDTEKCRWCRFVSADSVPYCILKAEGIELVEVLPGAPYLVFPKED